MTDLTEHELQILRELAGKAPPSPWGARVGACLEFLREKGLTSHIPTHWMPLPEPPK